MAGYRKDIKWNIIPVKMILITCIIHSYFLIASNAIIEQKLPIMGTKYSLLVKNYTNHHSSILSG